MKVLVIQQRYGIGDMIIFTPYFQALSEKIGHPLTVLAKKVQELQIYLKMISI